ncbi:hypothetical protein [Tumebacillus amylolyticus]|nr:hypothetical protein [Tumebacillus amylolyticus]
MEAVGFAVVAAHVLMMVGGILSAVVDGRKGEPWLAAAEGGIPV